MATKREPATRAAGRRPGSDSTREEILRTARTAFGATGYDGTSLRSVAVKAGVDPSTVIHFFGTKEGLFEAVIQGIAPATKPFVEALQRRAGGAELVRHYLQMWEDDQSGGAMRAVIRTSLTSEKAVKLLRETLTKHILRAASYANALHAEIAMTHLIGIGMGRYIAHLPELTQADIPTIAESVGPILDHYLGVSPMRT